MQTRVDQRVFERTDFGSLGWLKEGPLTSPYDVSFFAATKDLTQSFRTREREGLPSVRTDFGSFAWIFEAIPFVFDASLFAGVDALLRSSFRPEDKERLDSRLTDFGSFGWLREGPLTPPYDVSFFVSTDAQSNSFRADEDKRLDVLLHLTQPVFSMWFQGGTGPMMTIDGAETARLTVQYENIMVGSDNTNSVWDIL